MVDLILLPTATTARRHIDMRMALQSNMTGHAEMEAHIKPFLHPQLPGNLLHTIKAIPIRPPTTLYLIRTTPNSLQDTLATSHLMTTKTELQQTLGIPAKPHITATAITPSRRRDKVITTHMGMVTAMLNIRRQREDGLPRIHQKNGCVSGFLDMRARSSVVHTRTLAFSMTNSSNMTTTPSSNLILDLG
jgi:hypothetical protein